MTRATTTIPSHDLTFIDEVAKFRDVEARWKSFLKQIRCNAQNADLEAGLITEDDLVQPYYLVNEADLRRIKRRAIRLLERVHTSTGMYHLSEVNRTRLTPLRGGLRDGRIVFYGTPAQLTTGAARDIYGAEADFSKAVRSTEIEPLTRPRKHFGTLLIRLPFLISFEISEHIYDHRTAKSIQINDFFVCSLNSLGNVTDRAISTSVPTDPPTPDAGNEETRASTENMTDVDPGDLLADSSADSDAGTPKDIAAPTTMVGSG
ncbi:hypothetical protein ROLI_001260 [Roseobacter fucihabitans]|uniref:Uncharacterized protein n=1 Tax=Roseobacter fucihabitans TaxID=1537242 RepID=A0ABZ2BLQ1_9RHOB|nr:hypothetical protein [Roseobacter litoralis]